MNLKELVGKEVFLRPTGNFARYHGEGIILDKVVNVARVFITLENEGKLRIGLEQGGYVPLIKDDANGGYDLFDSKDSIKKETQRGKIRSQLYQIFSGYSQKSKDLSYEKLTAIAKILEIDYE